MIDEFGQEIGEPCDGCGRAEGKNGCDGMLLCNECAEHWERTHNEGLTVEEREDIELAHWEGGDWQ